MSVFHWYLATHFLLAAEPPSTSTRAVSGGARDKSPSSSSKKSPERRTSAGVSGLDEVFWRSLETPTAGLTSQQVALTAAQTSEVARQRAAEVQGADATVNQSIVAMFPKLRLEGRYMRLSAIEEQLIGNVVVAPTSEVGPLGPGSILANAPLVLPVIRNQWFFHATLLVPLSDYLLRVPQGYLSAQAAKESATLQMRASRLSAALDGRLVFFQWARSKFQTRVAEQSLDQTRTHREAADHRFEAGSLSNADLLRIDAQVAQAEVLVLKAKSLERVLEVQLRTLMHRSDTEGLQVGESLMKPLATYELLSIDELMEQARRGRIELKALQKASESLNGQIVAARADYFPHLDLFAGATYANPNSRYFPPKDAFKMTWEMGAQVTIIPNEVALAATWVDVAKAKRSQIEAQQHQFVDALRIEVAQAVEAVRESDASVGATQRGLLAAEEAYRVRRELFVNERSNTTELTDAEAHLTQARLAAVAARIDQRIARARLEHATGADEAKL